MVSFAFELFPPMMAVGNDPHQPAWGFSHGSAEVSACERVGQWQMAVQLMEKMQGDKAWDPAENLCLAPTHGLGNLCLAPTQGDYCWLSQLFAN